MVEGRKHLETEKCTQQPRNVTPIVLGTSDCTQLSKSNNEEDVDSNPITCQNDSQLENTQVILDVRESIEAMESMETHLTHLHYLLLNRKTKTQVQQVY